MRIGDETWASNIPLVLCEIEMFLSHGHVQKIAHLSKIWCNGIRLFARLKRVFCYSSFFWLGHFPFRFVFRSMSLRWAVPHLLVKMTQMITSKMQNNVCG